MPHLPIQPPLTIYESRLLPGAIALLLATLACLIVWFDKTEKVHVWVAGTSALAAMYPLYRCFRPRWVLRLGEGKLSYHDLRTKRVDELELASVLGVRLTEEVTEGGYQNYLVVTTSDRAITWTLPFLQMSAPKTLRTVQTYLPPQAEAVNK